MIRDQCRWSVLPLCRRDREWLQIKGQPILTFPRGGTHPNLPKGKELVTSIIVISPHLTSPVGEGQIHLTA